MDESKIRKQSISRYENSESCKQIYQSLGKSKKWFFKWLKCYKLGGKNWSEGPSRRQHYSKKIEKAIKQVIIDTRKKLRSTLYTHIGALNIR